MKKIRFYVDVESERTWLQKMANEGWALKKYFLGVYTFEKCEPGQYRYQIDLLDNTNNRDDFEAFMKEMDVDVLCYWNKWAYLRRDSSQGKFEMYTDAESQIKQYKRLKNFYLTFIFIELCFIPNIINNLVAALNSDILERQIIGGVMLFFTIFLIFVILCILKMIWKCQFRIDEIKRQNEDI